MGFTSLSVFSELQASSRVSTDHILCGCDCEFSVNQGALKHMQLTLKLYTCQQCCEVTTNGYCQSMKHHLPLSGRCPERPPPPSPNTHTHPHTSCECTQHCQCHCHACTYMGSISATSLGMSSSTLCYKSSRLRHHVQVMNHSCWIGWYHLTG